MVHQSMSQLFFHVGNSLLLHLLHDEAQILTLEPAIQDMEPPLDLPHPEDGRLLLRTMAEGTEVTTLIEEGHVRAHQEGIVLGLDRYRPDRDHPQDVEGVAVVIEEIALAGVVDEEDAA